MERNIEWVCNLNTKETKIARQRVLQKILKRKKFHEIAIKKTILTGNCAQIKESNRGFTNRRNLYPAFVVVATSPFIPDGV